MDIRLRVGSVERQAVQIVRNGKIADILITPIPSAKPTGDTMDAGDAIRVDLATLTETRRTPLRVPNRPSARPMILPTEFFTGTYLES